MGPDHPLANNDTIPLRDCLRFPVAMPTAPYGVRHLMELAVRRTSLDLNPVVESDSFDFLRHYAAAENILSFQLPIGLPALDGDEGVVTRPALTT